VTAGNTPPPSTTVGAHCDDPETIWLTDRLHQVCADVNFTYWKFALSFTTCAGVLGYAPGGGLAWHLDLSAGMSTLKVFAVALLSDPADFDGGDFCVLTGSEATRINLQRGAILVAPAWLLHTVAPVTDGYRWSVVLQVHGRPWR
jgi:hypothetical protein